MQIQFQQKSKSTPLPKTSNELSKEADLKKPEGAKDEQSNTTDLFFSCADWETQIGPNENQDSLLSSQKFAVPSTPKKRIQK